MCASWQLKHLNYSKRSCCFRSLIILISLSFISIYFNIFAHNKPAFIWSSDRHNVMADRSAPSRYAISVPLGTCQHWAVRFERYTLSGKSTTGP